MGPAVQVLAVQAVQAVHAVQAVQTVQAVQALHTAQQLVLLNLLWVSPPHLHPMRPVTSLQQQEQQQRRQGLRCTMMGGSLAIVAGTIGMQGGVGQAAALTTVTQGHVGGTWDGAGTHSAAIGRQLAERGIRRS